MDLDIVQLKQLNIAMWACKRGVVSLKQRARLVPCRRMHSGRPTFGAEARHQVFLHHQHILSPEYNTERKTTEAFQTCVLVCVTFYEYLFFVQEGIRPIFLHPI